MTKNCKTSDNPMRITIPEIIVEEMSDAISDALAGRINDPSDQTYIKIHNAKQLAGLSKYGVTLEIDSFDFIELKDRAECNVGPGGVCLENLDNCGTDPADKKYWIDRTLAYRSLLAQLNSLKG